MTIATFGCCVTVRASGISIECKYEPILYLPDYVRKMSTPPHSFWYITLLHLYTAWFREVSRKPLLGAYSGSPESLPNNFPSLLLALY